MRAPARCCAGPGTGGAARDGRLGSPVDRVGRMSLFKSAALVVAVALMSSPHAAVAADEVRIAVLAFELNDLTLDPNTPQEVERTASIAPLLREALTARAGYHVVEIDARTAESANAGTGYLFDHHDSAAELARAAGAGWVVIGRVHKPSALFAYFKAHLVNAASGQLAGDLVVEVKGPQRELTARGVAQLADQIATIVARGDK